MQNGPYKLKTIENIFKNTSKKLASQTDTENLGFNFSSEICRLLAWKIYIQEMVWFYL